MLVCFCFLTHLPFLYSIFPQHVFVSEFHNEEEEPIYPHGPLRLPIDDNIKVRTLTLNWVQLLVAVVAVVAVWGKVSLRLGRWLLGAV